MPSLISDYLPLVVFVILGDADPRALLVAPFLLAYQGAGCREAVAPTNAASTRSTTRA